MNEIRHIALAVPDPWATAEFYKNVFGFEVVGETDSSLAEGVFLCDGVINVALLHFKTEKGAQGRGVDFVGFHHFGIWVDDVEGTGARIEAEGGKWLMGEPDYRHNAAYEVKYHDINGVIVDLVHNGWAGAQRRPGQDDNEIAPTRSLVPRFAERREAAAKAAAERMGDSPKPKGALRHIAISVPDPWATAAFYRKIFGFEVVGETDSGLAEGVYISDGVFNIAFLDFTTDYAAQGLGKDFVGLHHFGLWVDDVPGTGAVIERAGGAWFMGELPDMSTTFYEVKYHDINGVIIDLVHNGWAGAQKLPGQPGNETCPPRKLVPRFAPRRTWEAPALADAAS